MQIRKIISATLVLVIGSLIFLGAINNYNARYGSAGNMFVEAAYPSVISFSGYTWYVENSIQPTNPGPNYWSNSPENVWVDDNGWLHLKITYRDGHWYCPELTTLQTFGYGTYAFYTVSRIDTLDKNVILGLFAYKDDSHEIDIEFSRWAISDYNNGWFTVQPPPYDNNNQKSFNIQLHGDYSTHYFTWTRKSIYFESFGGHYPIGSQPSENVISRFTSYERVNPQDIRAHINLWLYEGAAPSNGLPVEVVIKSFQYIPLT